MVSPSMPSLGFFLTLTFAWLVFPREAQERWPKEEKGKQLFSWFSAGKPSWCQAEPGSCVGRRQTYKEPVVIDLVDREVKSIGDIRRFVDWDGDGDVDFLATYFDKVRQAHGYYGYHLGFFERLGNDTFRIHDLLQSCVDEVELHRFGYQYSELLHFEVADWDADGGMDVLVATYLNESLVVSWANRSTAMGHGELRRISVIMADSHLEPENEINEYSFPWNMKAVDWDLDGDADLILGSNYFERVDPDTVVQRIGDQNPLVPDMLNPSDISDISMDDDGYLNMVMAAVTHLEYGTRGGSRVSFRSFKRTLDGTFVEQVEHPLQDLWVENPMRQPPKSFLADWNSDGLPDIVVWNLWSQLEWYERTQERDMAQDHHTTLYDDIEIDGSCSELHLFDWNGDGFEDVLTYCGHQFQLYLFDGKKHLEVLGVFANITCNQACSIAMSDWDRDGDADVIITSNSGHVHYHEMIDGRLQEEQIQHPFSGLHLIVQGVSGGRWSGRWIPQPLAVDWDNDGDVDLVLGPPDFRYFERLYDSSLSEWSREESPFFIALAGDMDVVAWRFFDCDSDGDLDLVIVRVEPSYALVGTSFHVCEHTEHHALRCEGHILCLGTNLGNFHSESGPLGKLSGWDFGSARDGQLEVLTMHQDKVLHWRAGVCPALDPCHEKGLCLHGKTSCSCIEGHELADCSGCQPNFYSVEMSWGKAHGCEACPGEGGKVCHDRGLCFDDFAAKNDSQMATAALMARGHGSCLCSEGSFYGIDEQGRSTCAEGHCPAGTEETHGICISCQAGTYSLAGGACKKCGPGTKSSKGSSACERCSPGTISPGFGNSNCEECAAGKYEISRQWCNDCPSGSISSAGNDTCTKCTEGFYATLKGSSICDPCPAGTYSELGNTKCIPCPSGQFSGVGSSACSMCSAGTIASKAGSTECELCPAGTYAEEGGAKCIPCSLGQFSGVGSLACSMCGAGTIARQAGSTECELCPAGTYAEAGSSKCLACYAGTISGAGSGNCSHCASGHFAKDSVACEACPGGTAAIDGACRSCPSGRVSGPASASCSSCDSILIRRTPDPAKQNCQISGLEVVLALIGLLTSAGCCFLCFSGCCARVPIADISDAQGQKLVVTTSIAHQILKSKKAREVTFHNTEVPDLEKEPWKVSALSSFQLTLQADHRENPLDTSMGTLRLKFPLGFLVTGFWRCPTICWCLLFLAATVAIMSRLTWLLTLLLCCLGFLLGWSAFAFRRRARTPLAKRLRQFLKEWPLQLQSCPRGPERSITVGKLQDFLQFFDTFIKERSMYYVCGNIIKPLTEPFQLSWAEMVGPDPMEWFVSHYWGMAARHLGEAIRKHAQSASSTDWRDTAYWICTFSNSQWDVKAELGNGQWQESSFYKALQSPRCKGTAMIIDEQVWPLQRIWCLFEVYHTIRLTATGHFQGLRLCTSTGVLQEGQAGTDVAVAVARTAANLDTRGAKATSEGDRQMIHALIEAMPGGFAAMNSFVRETICLALEASNIHYEKTFKTLVAELTASIAKDEDERAPLPTLLTSVREQGGKDHKN